MKIEAIITCVNYSDFLAETLPENIEQLDRLVVITHPDDRGTRDLCARFGVECVETTAMHEDGDKFNKGRLINMGLGHLRGLDWILHLDADIVLPHGFRHMLHRGRLNQKKLYGADRVNVYGYEHWMEHKHRMVPHWSQRYFVEPPKEFPVGARIVHHEHGYTPIGYFQLFHSSLRRRYPIHQGNAEHTDVLFAAQWPRQDRELLPEVIVYHLESNTGPIPMGANWNGRTTPLFGPHGNHRKGHHGHGHEHHHRHHHHHRHPKPPYRPGEEPCGWKIEDASISAPKGDGEPNEG